MSPLDWSEASRSLTEALGLRSPPIAITFSDEVPEGLEPYGGKRPAPAADGRTGPVPAGCVFWTKALERSFTTVAADHANCSVGTLVHGFADMEAVASNSDVAALFESGWVAPEDVAAIPVVSGPTGSVSYGPLSEVSREPDVVMVRVGAGALMALEDAVPDLQIGGKPQCRVVALAKQQGVVAASLGCTLSRARTGQPDDELTCAIPGGRLGEVLEALARRATVNSLAESYAAADLERFASG